MSLTEMRKAAGLTMQAMADLMEGASVGRIGQWEQWGRDHPNGAAKNPRLMSLATARKAADALGVSLDEFERNL